MRSLLLLFIVVCGNAFAQFPHGRFYSVFADRAAITRIDSTSIALEGGNPIFDTVGKTILLDSAQEGQRITIVKMLSTSKSSWRLIGKNGGDSSAAVFALMDLVAIGPETFDLNFHKDEFTSREEAETHLRDSAASFGFRLMTEARVRHLMSLKPLRELTPKDMIAVYKATDDSMEVLMSQFKDQPDAALFAVLVRPMQITMDELVARGYNPLVQKAEADAVFEKLKVDPEVKKVIEASEAKRKKNDGE